MTRQTRKVTGSEIYINKVLYCGTNTNDSINPGNIFDRDIILEIINEVTNKWGKDKLFYSIPNQHS